MQPSRLLLEDITQDAYRGLTAALDASHAIVRFNRDGEVEGANAFAQALLDYPTTELEALTLADLTGEGHLSDRADTHRRHWSQVVAGAIRIEDRWLLNRQDEKIRCTITYTPVGAPSRPHQIVALIVPRSARISAHA